MPLPRDQSPSLVPVLLPQPLPETQCRRCQSGPGSGSCCRLPEQHSSGCPGRLWSVLEGPVPVRRSGSGSPCGSNSRSWGPLRMDGSGELGGHGGRRSDPHPLQAPIQRLVDGKPRPREGIALKQSYEDVLHALVHLTPSNYELQGRPRAYFSASSELAQSLAGAVNAE